MHVEYNLSLDHKFHFTVVVAKNGNSFSWVKKKKNSTNQHFSRSFVSGLQLAILVGVYFQRFFAYDCVLYKLSTCP